MISADFETYSEAGYVIDRATGKVRGAAARGKGGLPAVGTPVYAEHPSTDVISLAYDMHDGRGVHLWLPGTPDPVDLLDAVRRGEPFAAWNVTFEWWIWNMVCVRRYGWPPLTLEQCHCDMARARRHSLPASLAAAAAVLGTSDKDKSGKNLIQKLTRPHSTTKNRQSVRRTPATDWGDFVAFWDYNKQDVVAEDAATAKIPPLSDYERQIWLTDQRINARGVQVDTVTLDAAIDVLGQAERRYTMRLAEVTQGAVGTVNEVAKMLEWCNARGAGMPDLTAGTVRDTLKRDDIAGDVRQVLKIREALSSANVKKLRTLKLQLSSDGRLRDQYKCFGADRTGRWAAGGVQLQNITAKGPKTYTCGDATCGKPFGKPFGKPDGDACPRCGSPLWGEAPEWTIDHVEHAIDDIRTASLDHVEHVWGDPIAVLCGCLRGMFTAREGHKLMCVDFSAIEAVVLACLSRCQWRIDVFNGDGKIYEMSASKITGTPLQVYADYYAEHGMHHGDRKKIGKVAELASGYGGWLNAWRAFGCDMTDNETKRAILAWREASPEIVEFWGGQYKWCGPGKWDYRPELHGLEGCAIKAIQNPGKYYHCSDISFAVGADDVMYVRLPSGRTLRYHRPRLSLGEDKLRRGPSYVISFEGYNSNAAKGRVGWGRWETFGGRLAENVTQAVALDIQAAALIRLEAAGYPVVMHTHDEAVVEVPDDPARAVEAMAAVMTERPSWASWWPIRGGGWEHKRYQKD